MLHKTKFLYPVIIAMSMMACKKSDHHEESESLTSITINSPYENQLIKKGDTLTISGNINSPSEIHGYDVYLIQNTNDTIFLAEEHVHAKSITVSKPWINNLSTATDLQLIVVATIDHDGKTISAKRLFKTTI